MTDEKALTLQQVADRLGLAYSTIFAKRQQIGFRLPGSRVWRVWPSRLAELSAPRYNVTRLVLGDDTGDDTCRSNSEMVLGGSIYARQAAKELDEVLARATAKRRRNTTTA